MYIIFTAKCCLTSCMSDRNREKNTQNMLFGFGEFQCLSVGCSTQHTFGLFMTFAPIHWIHLTKINTTCIWVISEALSSFFINSTVHQLDTLVTIHIMYPEHYNRFFKIV